MKNQRGKKMLHKQQGGKRNTTKESYHHYYGDGNQDAHADDVILITGKDVSTNTGTMESVLKVLAGCSK